MKNPFGSNLKLLMFFILFLALPFPLFGAENPDDNPWKYEPEYESIATEHCTVTHAFRSHEHETRTGNNTNYTYQSDTFDEVKDDQGVTLGLYSRENQNPDGSEDIYHEYTFTDEYGRPIKVTESWGYDKDGNIAYMNPPEEVPFEKDGGLAFDSVSNPGTPNETTANVILGGDKMKVDLPQNQSKIYDLINNQIYHIDYLAKSYRLSDIDICEQLGLLIQPYLGYFQQVLEILGKIPADQSAGSSLPAEASAKIK
ncbi:MAG: hypothetical protein WC901_00005, partial [Candidatus Margulisiibacteriota bacterium]